MARATGTRNLTMGTRARLARRRWGGFYQERIEPIFLYGRRNPSLIVGLAMLGTLLLFTVIGLFGYAQLEPHTNDPSQNSRLDAFVSGGAPVGDKRLPPSWCTWCEDIAELEGDKKPTLFQYPMGTDTQARDLFATNLRGIPLTLGTGLIAGLLSVGIGTVTAFVAAYYRGVPDVAIRLLTDVGISIPGLLILIIIRIQLGTELLWWQLGAGLAAVGWVFSSRTVRSQVLVLREQPYVEIARQSGMSGLAIIFREMMPNLIPYITASFVASVAGSILASIGLEALGLGDFSSPSLGMTVYWVIQFGAITLGMWWWWLFPLAFIVIIFVSLFLISAGLDEWSNPRLRRQV
ncbi:MAG: ABC transporter permease [Chloroflexi bacterium]|nr:ABC transporter permease [Chloroflexota bacterium]MYK61108.1 ABC transporter permease [Chloroflexota bacterium]